MLQRSSLRVFSARLVLVYVLLLLPWPGFSEAYALYFRTLGETAFCGYNERYELDFQAPDKNSPRPQDTCVAIVNRSLMAPDGSGPVRNLTFDARRIGWSPMALLIALILATPIPWQRRVRSLLFGTLCVHVFILLTLGVCIWNESTEIGLVTLSPLGKTIANGCKVMLTSQISLVAPVLIWILVTFRRA